MTRTLPTIVLAGIGALGAAALGIGGTTSGAAAAAARGAATATAELKDRQGAKIGEAKLIQAPSGVLIAVKLTSAPAGDHAFHIHETGRCDMPDFKSAGGHFKPADRKHGFLDPYGPHAGDLPNIHVPESGKLEFEAVAGQVSLGKAPNALLDRDGAALVMHALRDDYQTDPAGTSGDRIACGVIGASGPPRGSE